ncbi:metallophosphoesterase family protein [Nocardioides litoris]|uniref:metallophosphoesterase family protein n=1 Tax=Nocardioides litoris TaxID=1926648 RepID=UPI001123DAFB|nr:metallophosphoesterase [Nocardioides litoris]
MHRALREARRLAVCVLVAGLLGLPLAFSWAVTHTEVTQQIGTSPTTFTLSTQGHSEVRLGIAGTVYVPESQGRLGIVATLDGPGDPGAGDGDLAAYVRPEMLQLYTGLFHDPGAAVEEYVSLVQDELRRQLLLAVAFTAGVGGLAAYAVLRLAPVSVRREGGHARLRIGLAALLVLATTSGLAWVQLRGSDGGRGPTAGVYPLTALDGTLAAGATTDSPVVRALLGGVVSKAQVLVDRQEEQEKTYREAALASLAGQAPLVEAPREGEVAVMMQSDMHCNTTMIRLQREVWSTLDEAGSAPAVLAIAGDLTTNGTAAEGVCIRDERAIAGDAPVAAIGGNHESATSEDQMREAGMTVLDGDVEEVGDVRVLGDLDPSRTELFGGSSLRGDEGQDGQGRRLRDVAEDAGDDRPDLVMVHEAYAAQAFLGIASVDEWLTGDDTGTGAARVAERPDDAEADGVPDVPAGVVVYGHWHRQVEPRVAWNSDGSWTFVMELDTSGGAIDTPTLGNFSTPWSRPQQEASFPVLFLDEETRMVTGYQLYRFDTDATVTVEPRVEVGAPDASTGTAGTAGSR